MHVKVISLEKCDGTPATVELVKKTALEMGIPIEFEHVLVHTQEDARLHRLIGSPTTELTTILKQGCFSGLVLPEDYMGYRRYPLKN